MKPSFKIIVLSVLVITASAAKSQVLITLLLGDALNTPKIEFGLMGGGNYSNIRTIEEAEPLPNFNLGFYFHFLLKNNSYLSTGVLVKSNVGAQGMPTYSLNNENFDALYEDGTLAKKINYFYVPALYHHRFLDNRFYLEAGFQLGLRNKAFDVFSVNALDGDLEFTLDTRDQFARLDAGLLAGGAYKFKKQVKSLSLGMYYYYGLVNVSLTDQVIKNSSIYLFLKIPIGAGKADN
jgi:hypothetical protein